MLIGIHALLTPDLLHALASMGHGDTIVLVDANYPVTRGKRSLEMPGASAVASLRAVLSILPLDTFVPHPAMVMQMVGDPETVAPPIAEMNDVLAAGGHKPAHALERYTFYDAASQAYAIVRTGERRFYGNIILCKGVIPPPEKR
jgi:L-fucose mutarotase